MNLLSVQRWLKHFKQWVRMFPIKDYHLIVGQCGDEVGECLICHKLEADGDGSEVVTDEMGSYWPARCGTCGCRVQVVRPGKAQCPKCGALGEGKPVRENWLDADDDDGGGVGAVES